VRLKPIKVLVVDDSLLVRHSFSEILNSEPDIEVVGTAPDPFVARDLILELKPDVLTLDVEMPRMDGITFLKKLTKHSPMPVIIVSSLTQKGSEVAMDALEAGAVEVIAKPGPGYNLNDMKAHLISAVKAAYKSRHQIKNHSLFAFKSAKQKFSLQKQSKKIIAIGASTGGTSAIYSILSMLPSDIPGIVIVQHLPAHFTKSFAKRLDNGCTLNVKEAKDGDIIQEGTALIAPGNLHMTIKKSGQSHMARIKSGHRVCFQRPSIDVLFKSIAKADPLHTVAVILTGMGSDGADGMKQLKDAGAYTIAQDESSSLIFGMPKQAIARGGVSSIVPLESVAKKIIEAL